MRLSPTRQCRPPVSVAHPVSRQLCSYHSITDELAVLRSYPGKSSAREVVNAFGPFGRRDG